MDSAVDCHSLPLEPVPCSSGHLTMPRIPSCWGRLSCVTNGPPASSEIAGKPLAVQSTSSLEPHAPQGLHARVSSSDSQVKRCVDMEWTVLCTLCLLPPGREVHLRAGPIILAPRSSD